MNWENIHFDPNDLENFQKTGSYFQAASDAHIYIGSGTRIAGNPARIIRMLEGADCNLQKE